MQCAAPKNVKELAHVLRDCGASQKTLETGGFFSKQSAGGEIFTSDVKLSTRNLNRVIAYEPSDLTISVEAGLSYSDLLQVLAEKKQFLPLDPPFEKNATVGGVIATNGNGPKRRRYGTARDMVIGMKFTTIEGKTVQSGGMVVKNVTGLDMGKLMIGSYGTLAVMCVINFKVSPIPNSCLSVVFSSNALSSLAIIRSELLGGVIQPRAIDLFNVGAIREWSIAPTLELTGYGLAVEIEGSPATIVRCRQELDAIAKKQPEVTTHLLTESTAKVLWENIQETTAQFFPNNPDAHVIRISTVPSRIKEIFELAETDDLRSPVIVRAGNAVGYIYARGTANAKNYISKAQEKGLTAIVEYAPLGQKTKLEQWPSPRPDLAIMKRIKNELDPQNLLNYGRMFNQL